MSGKCSRGGHSSRASVEIALNNAIDVATEVGNSEGLDHILKEYDKIYKTKHNGSSKGNIVRQLINSDAPILASYSYIWKKQANIPWGKHFHATFIVAIAADNEDGIAYIEFSHAVQFILINPHRAPSNNATQKTTCFVKKPTNKTLGDVTRMAIYHWYAVNGIKTKFQWPTSCTGFTDVLMYYTYGKNFDILSHCPLTIQRTVKGMGQAHHIYTDPIEPISADVTTIIDENVQVRAAPVPARSGPSVRMSSPSVSRSGPIRRQRTRHRAPATVQHCPTRCSRPNPPPGCRACLARAGRRVADFVRPINPWGFGHRRKSLRRSRKCKSPMRKSKRRKSRRKSLRRSRKKSHRRSRRRRSVKTINRRMRYLR